MAGTSAGDLTFQFKADLSDLKKGLEEIKSQLQKVSDSAGQAGGKIKNSMNEATVETTKLGAGMVAVGNLISGMVQQFARFSVEGVKLAIKSVAELGDTARVTGESVRTLQQLQLAASGKGLGGSDFLKGIEGFASKLDEAKRDANDLTGQFAAAGVKITDAAGKQRVLTDLLGEAATMVQKAGNGFDKIKIAENLGLTKEWVPFLEQGAEAIQKQAEAAGLTGNIINDQLVAKAREFENSWNAMIASWTQTFKVAIMAIAEALESLWGKAKGVIDLMQSASVSAKLTFGYAFDSNDAAYVRKGIQEGHVTMTDRLRSAMEGQSKEQRGSFRQSELQSQDEPANSITVSRPRSTGRATPVFRGAGGGGGAETADAVERYIASLERSKDVLKQEIDLWGKTRTEVEAAKALEMARAAAKKEGRDLTEAEVQKVRQLGTAYGSLKDKLEELRDRQQSMLQIAQTFSSAIADWAINGTKAKDVFASLAKSIANMALQATLMGQGPLAGLFGTKSADGGNSLGGLFGSLVGGLGSFKLPGFAAGGTVPGNQWAVVGEQGPELIRSGSGGATVIPNGGITGSGVPVVNVHNYAGAAVQVKQSKGPTGPSIDVVLTELVLRDVNQRGPISQALGARRF